jgi:hypothetical protein
VDAAKLLAEAEVERVKGVANANRIIGESFKGNEAYLRYFWLSGWVPTISTGIVSGASSPP